MREGRLAVHTARAGDREPQGLAGGEWPDIAAALRTVRERVSKQRRAEILTRRLDLASCIASPSSAVGMECARVLVEAGFLDEGELIYRTLSRCASSNPGGFIGLAQVATCKRLWSDALTGWDEVLRRFPRDCDVPSWSAARAHTLLKLGHADEAEHVFRELRRCCMGSAEVLLGLLRVLIVTGRPDEALVEIDSSELKSAQIPGIIQTRLESLVMLRRTDEARHELERLLVTSHDSSVLEVLFNYVPQLYERWGKTRVWLSLLRKVEELEGRRHTPADGYATLRLRLLLALRDYQQFLSLLETIQEPRTLGVHGDSIQAVARALRDPSFPDHHKPKIFGIGLSKTGTTTLGCALQRLGFQVLDWINPLTRELICEDDLYLFDAFTDTPSAVCFERLYHLFAQSKFIYTVRPIDAWQGSMIRHWRRNYGVTDFEQSRKLVAGRHAFHFGRAFSDIHLPLYFNHSDYHTAYRAHERRVRHFFSDKPQNRLLELDVFAGHGWRELCCFLDRQMPAAPFPWENRTPHC
jgi:hypothetical protein